MNLKKRLQLSGMMFLEYFIWGAWYVTLGTYLLNTLHTNSISVGQAYGTFAISAMISPFIAGYISDKFLHPNKLLGFLQIGGGILLLILSYINAFYLFYIVILIYNLCFTPTFSLTNSITLSHLKNAKKEFPSIRAAGTTGFIAAGLTIGFMQIEKDAMTFRIAAIASLTLGLFAFLLPKTDPQPSSGQKVSFRTEIFGIFKNNRNFTVLITLSLLLCVFLMFYYSFANPFLNDIGLKNAAGKMTLGQVSELLIMLAMPYFFVHLGTKKMLLIGVGAWTLRYLLFAVGNTNEFIWMLYLGIILHGLCYNFFFVTGQIYVDKIVPARLKSTGQGLYTFVTYGIGYYLSTWIAGIVVHHFRDGSSYHWKPIWIFPGIMSGIILLLFLFLFKSRKTIRAKNDH